MGEKSQAYKKLYAVRYHFSEISEKAKLWWKKKKKVPPWVRPLVQGAWGEFENYENVLYLSYDGGYMTILIGQNFPEYTLKIH